MEKLNKTIAIIISITILSFSIWFMINDKKEFSDNEFRYLQKFPTFTFENLKSGKYIEELESYFTDHFPLRENFVSLKTLIYNLSGQTLINNVYIGKNNYLINKFDKPKNKDKIISTINKFKENNKDINIDIMIVPTATSIYSNYLPETAINYSEKETIEYYYNNLNVNKINLYNTLINNKNKYQLYYKTDHHWTSFGSYIAYQEYMKNKGLNYYDINELEVKLVSQEFLGTLYSKVFTLNQEKDKIYKINTKENNFTVEYLTKTTNTLYEEEYLKKKDKYSYFLNTNQPLIKITNNNLDNNKEILIVKDSFANSFIPLLANHYEKIHVIDLRYYNLPISNYMNENNLKDILLLYNINTLDTDTGINNLR